MKKTVENLLELQKLSFKTKGDQGKGGAEIEALRKKIPASFLANFDRSQMRGKKSVAFVNHGVCSECHLQIPLGVVMSLASTEDVLRCGNCGRYLYLPESAPPSPPAPPAKPAAPAKPAKERARRELAHAG